MFIARFIIIGIKSCVYVSGIYMKEQQTRFLDVQKPH